MRLCNRSEILFLCVMGRIWNRMLSTQGECTVCTGLGHVDVFERKDIPGYIYLLWTSDRILTSRPLWDKSLIIQS